MNESLRKKTWLVLFTTGYSKHCTFWGFILFGVLWLSVNVHVCVCRCVSKQVCWGTRPEKRSALHCDWLSNLQQSKMAASCQHGVNFSSLAQDQAACSCWFGFEYLFAGVSLFPFFSLTVMRVSDRLNITVFFIVKLSLFSLSKC